MKKISVVSITPLAVERDSRTYKEAASFARAGFNSIVVEGETSKLDRRTIPFQLISPRNKITSHSDDGNAKRTNNTIVKKIRNLSFFKFMNYLMRFFFFKEDKWFGFYLYDLIPKADLYYLHAPYYFPTILRILRKHKVSFIYDAHDFYSNIQNDDELNIIGRTINKFHVVLERICIQRAAEVITVSDGVAGLIEGKFGRRPIVIRNFQDSRIAQIPQLDVRKYLGIGKDVFLLVVVGNAKQGQALGEFLEALSLLPEQVHAAFVGSGYKKLLKLDQHPALLGRVHYVPPVKPYEVVPFIHNANASVILYYNRSVNYFYCLPNGFFQSVSAGLPILYPGLPEIEKLAKQYKLGKIIDPQDAHSIMQGVQSIMAVDELSKIRKHVENASELLDWKVEEKKLIKIIQKYV